MTGGIKLVDLLHITYRIDWIELQSHLSFEDDLQGCCNKRNCSIKTALKEVKKFATRSDIGKYWEIYFLSPFTCRELRNDVLILKMHCWVSVCALCTDCIIICEKDHEMKIVVEINNLTLRQTKVSEMFSCMNELISRLLKIAHCWKYWRLFFE